MADFNSDWQGHPIWQTGQPANVNYHTYHINMINMDRRATPPWQVISPTWGPSLSCKQASCSLFSFLPFLLFIFYKLSFFVLIFLFLLKQISRWWLSEKYVNSLSLKAKFSELHIWLQQTGVESHAKASFLYQYMYTVKWSVKNGMVDIDQECCRAFSVLHDAPVMKKKKTRTVLDGFRPGH